MKSEIDPREYLRILTPPSERHIQGDVDHIELLSGVQNTLAYLHKVATETDVEGCTPPELMDRTVGISTPWVGIEDKVDDARFSHKIQARYVSYQIIGLRQREVIQVRFVSEAGTHATTPQEKVLIHADGLEIINPHQEYLRPHEEEMPTSKRYDFVDPEHIYDLEEVYSEWLYALQWRLEKNLSTS